MLLRNFVILTVVMYSGGLIFMYLEADEASKALSPNAELSSLKEVIRKALNSSEDQVNCLFFNLEVAIKQNGGKEPYSWDYYESCFFVGSLITTIGYGHIAPKTHAGQIFTIIYSLIGIPLTMLVLRNLSAKITSTVTKIVTFLFRVKANVKKAKRRKQRRLSVGLSPKLRTKLREWKMREPRRKESKEFSHSDTKVKISCIIVLMALVTLFILLSAVLRIVSEGWDFHHSVYFWFITLTTVGFGDYVPYEGRKPESLVATIVYYIGTFYLLIGLALIASLIQCLSVLLEGRLPTVVAPEEPTSINVITSNTPSTKRNDPRSSNLSQVDSRYADLPGEHITHAVVECSAPFMSLFVSSSQRNTPKPDQG